MSAPVHELGIRSSVSTGSGGSHSQSGCTTDPNRIDANRGTVVAIGFDAQPPGTFAGINLEEPENYGVNPRGIGYDLRGATRVCFNAVAPASNPAGFQVQFLVALHPTPFVSVPVQWTEMCFDFTFLGLSDEDLSNVHFLFTVVTNDVHAGAGGRVLLDRIRFEPAPTAQQTVLSFPLANRPLGVMPVADVLPGRVEIPPDQVLANLTTTYESAMAMLVLLGREALVMRPVQGLLPMRSSTCSRTTIAAIRFHLRRMDRSRRTTRTSAMRSFSTTIKGPGKAAVAKHGCLDSASNRISVDRVTFVSSSMERRAGTPRLR